MHLTKKQKLLGYRPNTISPKNVTAITIGAALLLIGSFDNTATAKSASASQGGPVVGSEVADIVIPSPKPIITAPSYKSYLQEISKKLDKGKDPGPVMPIESPHSAQSLVAGPDVDAADLFVRNNGVPWVLEIAQHPWPLRYSEPALLTSLILGLPAVNEIRVALPGPVADMVERSRFAVQKFITDSIGSGASARRQQLQNLISWLERTEAQEKTLTNHPWVLYQFRLEARGEVLAFRDKVSRQSSPSLAYMAQTAQVAIEAMGRLMNLLPTYELRVALYNVMTQLKDGVVLYATQVERGDEQVLSVLDRYLNDNPEIAIPAGEAPKKENRLGGGIAKPSAREQSLAAASAAITTLIPTVSTPHAGPDLAVIPISKSEGGISAIGLGILAAILLGFIGFFIKIKRAVSNRKNKVPKI